MTASAAVRRPFLTQVALNNLLIILGSSTSTLLLLKIINQHCLNPLGHGVYQSFTGFHWSPLPLIHDDITELVDIRELELLHLLFEDAPHVLNRV